MRLEVLRPTAAGRGISSVRRVLHVLRKFDAGGIERWLLDVARAGIPGWEIEFALETEEPGTLHADILATGTRVHVIGKGNSVALTRVLRERGIDAVHSHVHAFSGFVLGVAKLAQIPVRIAHSHCCEAAGGSFLRRSYFFAMQRAIRLFATSRLAVSRNAAMSLFGTPAFCFVPPARRFADITPVPGGDRLVIGHVGRAVPVKNHIFLRSIASRMDSELMDSSFATPEEIYARSNVFVFPSLSEGLGLAVVEAQAAGIPCVVSDGVPVEACVIPDLVTRLPLSARLDAWCTAVKDAARKGRRGDSMQWIARSPFSLDRNIALLRRIYGGV